MSCEGHRHKYFQHISAAVSAAVSAAPSGEGEPEVDPETLERQFNAARQAPSDNTAREREAEVKTRLLFADMQRLGIKPPTHSPTGLPKKDAQHGYAAVYDRLKEIGYFDGEGGMLKAAAFETDKVATQADISSSWIGIAADQGQATDKEPLWKYIPRCGSCGRWLPTQAPVCQNPRCGMKSQGQGEPVPWPPPGFSFKRSRVRAAPPETGPQIGQVVAGSELPADTKLPVGNDLPEGDLPPASLPPATLPQYRKAIIGGGTWKGQTILTATEGPHAGTTGRGMTLAEAQNDLRRNLAKNSNSHFESTGEAFAATIRGKSGLHPANASPQQDATEPDTLLDEPLTVETPGLIAEDAMLDSMDWDAATVQPPAGSDYTFTPEELAEISQGAGLKTKARANLAAIKLLKQLQAEGRQATPDEQKILVRYTGWGGLPGCFAYENEWWESRRSYGPSKKPDFYDEWKELKELLSNEEFEAARRSTVNAHYTSPEVIGGVWKALGHLGFQATQASAILEPAIGIGHFFSGAPAEVKAARRVGIDLDATSAAIAAQLHQTADVRPCGFEATKLPDDFFDLAISNVPFGDYPVADPAFSGKRKYLAASIHNYFFAKALDKVKPGGVIAFVTSRYTLDAPSHQPVREYLASQADLVGAMRLPNTAFQGIANTEVTTDVIFLRKRFPHEQVGDSAWTRSEAFQGADGSAMEINRYFIDHPDMLLGRMESTGTMYYNRTPQLVSDGRDIGAAMNEAIGHLPPDALAGPHGRCGRCGAFLDKEGTCNNPRCAAHAPVQVAAPRVLADESMRAGEYVARDDGVYRVEAGQLVPHEKNAKTTQDGQEALEVQRIRGMIAVNEVARKLLRLNVAQADDTTLAQAQAELAAAYDAFVAKQGPLSSQANRRAFAGDPNLPFLLALEEDYDAGANTAKKTAIFSKRTIAVTGRAEKADTPLDALSITLNETGTVDWPRLAELTGKPVAALQKALAGSAVFQTPSGAWQTAEEYISGNVRKKLADAEAAAALDPTYRPNVEALRQVLPADLQAGDIHAAIGSSWIPTTDVAAFAAHLFKGAAFDVSYLNLLSEWHVSAKDTEHTWQSGSFNPNGKENTEIWGTRRMPGHKLLEMALNGQEPTVFDEIDDGEGKTRRVVNNDETLAARERLKKIREEFEKNWLFADPERTERLVRSYNELFNSEVPREYDGAHLTLPGMSAAMPELRRHQKNGIWRIAQGDNALLAHIVGAGKTFTMIGGGMELRRLGQRKKVMYSVPNHMLDQFAADIYRMYPGASVLALSSDDLTPQKRAETMSRIATGDWDAVVVTHTAMEKIPVSARSQAKFLEEEVRELREALVAAKAEEETANRGSYRKKKKDFSVKNIEKKLLAYEAKLATAQQKAAAKSDQTVEWEDLGVDQLFVDEADKFKNLDFPTRLTRLSGVQGRASSRAFDLFMKIRSMKDRYGGKQSTVFATGTPVANSLSEMYNMQRYLDLDGLKTVGLGSFDAWAKQFGEVVSSVEMKPSGGGYQVKERFAQFNNVPELKRLFMKVADIQVDADEMGLVRPKLAADEKGERRARGVACPASDGLKTYIDSLVERADHLSDKKPWEDNMLKITGDGRKAALDMRLVDPAAPDDPNSKINRCVQQVAEVYRQSTGVNVPGQDGPQNMAQMIFCDLGTPSSGEGFNVYADVKRKLVAQGIRPDEIAFMQDFKSDEEKFQLFQDVNAGKVRVLMGSTETMGSGTNAQRRLAALHHLDAPWRPRDIEQREGRIIRQGNLNEEVKIYRYLTEGSFDVYNWQLLERKQRFISQVMNRSLAERSAEDIDAQALTYAEMKAIATGNPAIIEKVAVDTELRKFEALERDYTNRSHRARQSLEALPAAIRSHEARLGELTAVQTAVQAGIAKEKVAEDGMRVRIEQARTWARSSAAAAKQANTPEARQQAEDAEQAAKSLAERFKRNGGFSMLLQGRTVEERDEAGRRLAAVEADLIQRGASHPGETVQIGEYLGFPLVARPGPQPGSLPDFAVQVGGQYVAIPHTAGERTFSPDHDTLNAPRIRRAIEAQPAAEVQRLQGALGAARADLDAARRIVSGGFEHAEKIAGLRRRAASLAALIDSLNRPAKEQIMAEEE